MEADQGRRVAAGSAASNSYGPYIIPTAHLLLDYFVINGFTDAKVCIFVYGDKSGGMNTFTPDPSRLRRDLPQPENFTSSHVMALAAWRDRSPVQHQYRTEWDDFNANLAAIATSKRPHLARSTAEMFVQRGEFLWVDQKGFALSANALAQLEAPPSDYRLVPGRVLLGEVQRRLLQRLGVSTGSIGEPA